MQSLTPTSARLSILRTFIETLQEKQYYDLEQQVSEAGANFAIRGEHPNRNEWAFFKFSEAVSVKATDQFESASSYLNKLLDSEFAKHSPNHLSILHAKTELASALETIMIATPNDALNPKRLKQVKQLLRELNEAPAQDKDEWPFIIQQANDEFKNYKTKVRTHLYFSDLEDYLETAAGQLANSQDLDKTQQQLTKSARGAVARGYLINLVRLIKATRLVKAGDIENAEPLARISQEYFVRRPYSVSVNHELGHLDQAYIAKEKFANARAVIDTRIALVEKNPHKDSDDSLLECLYAKGFCFENEERYSEAAEAYKNAFSTTFAKARPINKHALKAELSLARILWNKSDKTSKEEAIILLQKIANKRNLVEEDATTKSSASTALNIINQASELLVEYKSKGEQSSQKRP